MEREEVLQVVRNALDNFSHGRRIFAMQQLEALTDFDAGLNIPPSLWVEWLEGRCMMPRGHDIDTRKEV